MTKYRQCLFFLLGLLAGQAFGIDKRTEVACRRANSGACAELNEAFQVCLTSSSTSNYSSCLSDPRVEEAGQKVAEANSAGNPAVDPNRARKMGENCQAYYSRIGVENPPCPVSPPGAVTFMGIHKDSTREEVKQTLNCGFGNDGDVCMAFLSDDFRRGMPPMLSVRFTGGKFVWVQMTPKGDQQSNEYLEMLTERYGKPSSLKLSKIQNRMGAQFEKFEAFWRFKGIEIYLTNIDDKITEGSLRFVSTEGLKAYQAEDRRKKPNIF